MFDIIITLLSHWRSFFFLLNTFQVDGPRLRGSDVLDGQLEDGARHASHGSQRPITSGSQRKGHKSYEVHN